MLFGTPARFIATSIRRHRLGWPSIHTRMLPGRIKGRAGEEQVVPKIEVIGGLYTD
jgi:hypothetical protein